MIQDLRKDVSPPDIKAAVNEMGLNWLNSLLTAQILGWLRNRAHTQDDFRRMAEKTPFRTCEIKCDLIGMVVTLRKS